MKIIILEGIATSGKTTLKEKISGRLIDRNLKFEVINEETTLLPLLNNTDKEISLEFLREILNNALNKDIDVIIFDRLYFTHIFRTKSTLEDFSQIENILLEYDTLLVLLTIQGDQIEQRILGAMKHRDESWNDFVRMKGTDDEIVEYYTNQQKRLLELAQLSKLETLIIDTSNLGYDEIGELVVGYFKLDQ